jgi:Group II intron, maturase-specific domain
MRGWANCLKHAVCKHTLEAVENFTWHRVIRWWMHLHRWSWKDVRRHLTGPHGRWRGPVADGIELFKAHDRRAGQPSPASTPCAWRQLSCNVRASILSGTVSPPVDETFSAEEEHEMSPIADGPS